MYTELLEMWNAKYVHVHINYNYIVLLNCEVISLSVSALLLM